MSIDPETFRHEPAESVHGQLQRGRGAGYLAVLKLPRDEARELLLDCITRDPRIDSQIEDRAWFYASLVRELDLPLDGLLLHLQKYNDGNEDGWDTSLTICTLGVLARYGCREAINILREYVSWGVSWRDGLYELEQSKDPKNWFGLDDVICARFPDPECLEDALNWFCPDDPPWSEWEKVNPVIGKVVEKERSRVLEEREQQQDMSGENLPVAELLNPANDEYVSHHIRALRTKVQPSDAELLLASLSSTQPSVAMVALAGLAALAQPEFFESLIDYWRTCPDRPRRLRMLCVRALVALPSSVVLPLGRRWFNSTNDEERCLAVEILERHAIPDDAPMLQAGIRTSMRDEYGQLYSLFSMLKTFQRFPAYGPVPELEHAFAECCYSYARKTVARSIRITDPNSFVEKFSYECLWDSESDARKLACQTADLANPECRARIQVLADNWETENEVRDAAKQRVEEEPPR